MDLVLILDSSSSIGAENFALVRTFIKNLMGTFNIGDDAAQVIEDFIFLTFNHCIIQGDNNF